MGSPDDFRQDNIAGSHGKYFFSISVSVSFCMFSCSKEHWVRAYLDLKDLNQAQMLVYQGQRVLLQQSQYNLWLAKYKMMRQDKIDLVGKRLVFHPFSSQLARPRTTVLLWTVDL